MSSWRHKLAMAKQHQLRNPIPLEFTTTACNRPELLMITYTSLHKNLKGIDFTRSILYLNIDPMPNKEDIEMVEVIAKRYFGTVITRYTKHGSASEANAWVLRQPRGEFFFNIEDDWQLRKEINIFDMIEKLNRNSWIMQVYLIGSMIPEGRPTLPSLIRNSVIQPLLQLLNTNSNYEKQMIDIYHKIGKKSLSIKFSNTKSIFDIGKIWFDNMGLQRDDQNKWILSGSKNNVETAESNTSVEITQPIETTTHPVETAESSTSVEITQPVETAESSTSVEITQPETAESSTSVEITQL